MTRVIQLPPSDGEYFERRKNSPSPAITQPTPAVRTDAVYVVYTTPPETLAAVRVAYEFADALGLPVTVVHFRIVPYAVPVETPSGISPIETNGFVARLRAEGLNVRLRVYLCRDERRALPFVFKSHSLIVVAGPRRWWPTRAQNMRRLLEAAGHFVVFVNSSEYRGDGVHEAGRALLAAPMAKETSRA